MFEKIKSGAQIGDVMREERFKKHGKEIVNLFKKANEIEFSSGWTKNRIFCSLW